MAKDKEVTTEKKTRTVTYPATKTFIFSKGTTSENIDERCSEWLKKMASEGQAPMPGKCFSNHLTGDVYYVFIYMASAEFPALEEKIKLN